MTLMMSFQKLVELMRNDNQSKVIDMQEKPLGIYLIGSPLTTSWHTAQIKCLIDVNSVKVFISFDF